MNYVSDQWILLEVMVQDVRDEGAWSNTLVTVESKSRSKVRMKHELGGGLRVITVR